MVGVRFSQCLGLNTISSPEALPHDPQTGAWAAASLVNLDVLDGGRRLRTRPGFSLAEAGHWRDAYNAPDGRTYAVVDGLICEVRSPSETVPLVSLAAPGRVVWAALGLNVYWSNGVESGRILGGVVVPWGGYTWPVASEAGRYSDMPAGGVMAGFAGRVWIGDGSLLLYSVGDDAQFHEGAANYLEMPATITMLAPVDDGLYVGTMAGAWFLAGTDPTQGMPMTLVSADPVVPFSFVSVRSDEITKQVNPCGAAIWTSRRGIVFGLSGGIVIQPTKDNVALDVSPSYGAPVLLGRRYVVVLHP